MIGYVYHNGGSNTSNQDLGIKVAHSIGTFFGQLLFGYLADHIGRKRMYGVELVRSCAPVLQQESYLPILDHYHHWYSRSGGRRPCSRR